MQNVPTFTTHRFTPDKQITDNLSEIYSGWAIIGSGDEVEMKDYSGESRHYWLSKHYQGRVNR